MSKQNPKNSIGGQALIEGVLMRSPKVAAIAVRKPSGEITIEREENILWSKRHPLLGLFFFRGIVTLAETLSLGMRSLIRSADIAMEGEERKINPLEYTLSFSISILFSILLFFVLPAGAFTFLKSFNIPTIALNLIEGTIRIMIFFGFLLAVSFMPDMRRVFEYHGAEHKSIFLYEELKEKNEQDIKGSLTIPGTKKFTTYHPSCGTSFIIFVLIISILTFSFLGRPSFLLRVGLKLSLLPIIIGIAYELIKFSSRHKKNPFVRILIAPGLLLQRLTTREPSDDQVEVALEALKAVI